MMMKKASWLLFFALSSILLTGASKHIGPSYDTRPRDHLDLFAKEIARKMQLKIVGCGLGRLAGSEQGVWAISFASGQQLTLEEARPLVAEISFQLLSKIFDDPSFSKYCKITKQGPLKEADIGFRLAFWDQQTNRPLQPHLAQIRLADGNLYYHYADPDTQALQEPIVEPLEALNLPNYK